MYIILKIYTGALIVFLFMLGLAATTLSKHPDSRACNFFPCTEQLEQSDDDLMCCMRDGERTCCKLRDFISEAMSNFSQPSSLNNQIEQQPKPAGDVVSTIPATAGIIIGTGMLVIGFFAALYYCCRTPPAPGVPRTSPVVAQQEGDRTIVSVHASNRPAHVHIMISHDGHVSRSKHQPCDHPPPYDDIDQTSDPVTSLLLDGALPSYQDAAKM